MTLLLDTHVVLWLVGGDTKLGPRARSAIRSDDVRVSSVSVWEIAVKQAIGRLAPFDLDSVIESDDFPELAFTAAHGRLAGALPPHHQDPFDRALIAQAELEGLVLVTADRRLHDYDVALLEATR